MTKPKSRIKKIQARKAQDAAKEKAKRMRPYMSKLKDLDLRKELSKHQLNYINKAFEEFTELTSRPHKVYKPRKKSNLAKAQQYARHDKGGPKFDVAFIPTIEGEKTRVSVKGDEITVRTKYLTQRTVLFNMKNLAKDPEKEIARAITKHPKAQSFIIMAGKYQFNGGLTRNLVQNEVLKLMMRYSPGGEPYKIRGENSHYKNWLIGLEAYFYNNQDNFDAYRLAYEKKRLEELNERRNERNRFKRKYGSRINVFKK